MSLEQATTLIFKKRIYIALKQNYDKVVAESKILKNEIVSQKKYMHSLTKKYRDEKQNNLVELAEVSVVLESSREKWDKERSKLRKSCKHVQEAWQETKLELRKEQSQNRLQYTKLRTEKKQLESSKMQAEISATKYKNHLKVSQHSPKRKKHHGEIGKLN